MNDDEFPEELESTAPDEYGEAPYEYEDPPLVDAEDNVPGSIRAGLAAIGLLLIVGAIFVNRSVAILSLAVAFVVAAAIPLLVVELRRARMHRLAATGLLFGIAVIVAQLLLFALYPAWQGKLAGYAINLVTLGEKVMEKVNPSEGGTAPTFGNEVVDETLRDARESANAMRRQTVDTFEKHRRVIAQRVHDATEIAFTRRLMLAFQFALFLAGLCAIQYCFPEPEPVAPSADPNAPAPRGHLRRALCSACVVRITKGFIIGAVAAIGYGVGGINTWLFIAGVAMFLAIISSAAPAVATVMALIMVPLASSWQWALGAVAVTCLLLVAAEKRLHWYLVVMPGIKGGRLPAAFYKRQRPVATVRRSSSPGRMLMGIFSLCLHVAILGALALAVYVGYQGASASADRTRALAEARSQQRAKNYSQAIEAYEAILADQPNSRAAIRGLAQSYASNGNLTQALKYADQFAEWQPAPVPSTADPIAFLRYKIGDLMGWIEKPGLSKHLAHQEILSVAERSGEGLFQITERLLELDPKNLRAHAALASAAVENDDWEAAEEWARKGIAIDATYPGLHAALARALYHKDDLEGTIEAASHELEIDPENGLIEALRNRAQGELVAPPPDPGVPEQ
jgi:predicted PurR-regulated permease PerM